MAEDKKKPSYDYNRLTAKDMASYIEENHNDNESKTAFKKAAYVTEYKKKAVTKYAADGKPELYIDKNGKTKVRKKMIDDKSGEQKRTFKLLRARKYFYETYKNEIDFTNPPKTKSTTQKKETADDLFANW